MQKCRVELGPHLQFGAAGGESLEHPASRLQEQFGRRRLRNLGHIDFQGGDDRAELSDAAPAAATPWPGRADRSARSARRSHRTPCPSRIRRGRPLRSGHSVGPGLRRGAWRSPRTRLLLDPRARRHRFRPFLQRAATHPPHRCRYRALACRGEARRAATRPRWAPRAARPDFRGVPPPEWNSQGDSLAPRSPYPPRGLASYPTLVWARCETNGLAGASTIGRMSGVRNTSVAVRRRGLGRPTGRSAQVYCGVGGVAFGCGPGMSHSWRGGKVSN